MVSTAAVVDNSVIISWACPKQASDYTERLLDELSSTILHTAFIWPAEYGNATCTLVRRGILSPQQGDEMIGMATSFQLTVDQAPPALAHLYKIAIRHDLSVYDAAYLELALRLGVPLATRDEALAKAAKAAGLFFT